MQNKSIIVIIFAILICIGILLTNNTNLNPLATDPSHQPPYNTGIPVSSLNNLNTQRFVESSNWRGQDAKGGSGPFFTELLDDTKYVTSFSPSYDILSEKIVAQGNLREIATWDVAIPNRAYYKVELNEGGGWKQVLSLNAVDNTVIHVVAGSVGWVSINYNPVGLDQSIWGSALAFQVIGPHVGAIKVSWVVQFDSWIPGGGSWQRTMSTDYAYLISGSGRMNVAGYQVTDVPMFENGEKIPIQVSCDYSGPTVSGTGRWQLWAFPLRGGTGTMIKEWNYDFFRETVYWQLPNDAWVRGTADSKWRLELRNTLFTQQAVMINTIDVKANAPPTPTLSVNTGHPNNFCIVGEQISIMMSSGTNSKTNESVVKFVVRGVYLDGSEFAYKDVTCKGDPATATTTLAAPHTGKFKIQVWAHDAAGRESERAAEVELEANPTGSTPSPIPVQGDLYLVMIILIIIAVITIVGVSLYLTQRKKYGKGIKSKLKFKLFGRKK